MNSTYAPLGEIAIDHTTLETAPTPAALALPAPACAAPLLPGSSFLQMRILSWINAPYQHVLLTTKYNQPRPSGAV